MKFSAYVIQVYFFLQATFYSDLVEYVFRYGIWGSYSFVDEDWSFTVLDVSEMPCNEL